MPHDMVERVARAICDVYPNSAGDYVKCVFPNCDCADVGEASARAAIKALMEPTDCQLPDFAKLNRAITFYSQLPDGQYDEDVVKPVLMYLRTLMIAAEGDAMLTAALDESGD